jgi:hypothetical protein
MKRAIRFLRRFIIFFLLSVFMLLAIINAPWFFVNSKTTTEDYSSWMSETLDEETLIIEVKMLGAHDAFSHEIYISSPVDEKSADGLMTGFIGRLIKGFSIRQSKTQVVSASEQLKSGIRYLDMRLSYNEKEELYYTTHNYFSSKLEEVLSEITLFLSDNPGEFIVLDIQHVYGVDYNSIEDFEEIYECFEDSGILDYAVTNDQQLLDITYGDITQSKTKGGLIILSKFDTTNQYFFDYEGNIRSNWANEDEFDKIVTFLEDEKLSIMMSSYYGEFRVMQAVATMEMSFTGIMRSFETWSLLGRARDFNQYLFEYEGLEGLLDIMPILMLDFSTDYKIIDDYMELIISANS